MCQNSLNINIKHFVYLKHTQSLKFLKMFLEKMLKMLKIQ